MREACPLGQCRLLRRLCLVLACGVHFETPTSSLFFVAVPLAFSHLPGETFWPGCWIPRFTGRRGGAWRRA